MLSSLCWLCTVDHGSDRLRRLSMMHDGEVRLGECAPGRWVDHTVGRLGRVDHRVGMLGRLSSRVDHRVGGLGRVSSRVDHRMGRLGRVSSRVDHRVVRVNGRHSCMVTRGLSVKGSQPGAFSHMHAGHHGNLADTTEGGSADYHGISIISSQEEERLPSHHRRACLCACPDLYSNGGSTLR